MGEPRDRDAGGLMSGLQSPASGASRPGRTDGARFLRSKPTGKPKWKIWLILVPVLWAGYTALAGPQGLVRLYQIQAQERSLEQEVAHLTAQVDSLRTLERQIGKDPFLREKVAREVYGMARDDELIYFLKPGSEMPLGASGGGSLRSSPGSGASEGGESFGVPELGDDDGSGASGE